MSKVVSLTTTIDDRLERCKGKLDDVLIIGWSKGGLGIEVDSNMQNPDIIMLMELVKATIVESYYGYDD